MFSKSCQNILLFSVLATNFFTKYDDLHSIASLRHPTPIADHYECSNQAFKSSNGRNLNTNFQKKNSNMFSMLSTLTNMSIEHTHDLRLHQLIYKLKIKM